MMEDFDQFYVEENNKYLNILAKDMDNYAQTKQIFTFVKESKNNSTEKIKEELCQENNYCITYLNSKDNIFDSGVDFAFQTSIKETTNILLEYKKLDNDQKFNINIINETLIYTQNSKFVDISLALQYMFVSVENKIIKGFDADEISRRSICDGLIDTPLFFQAQRGVIRIHRSNGKAKVVDVILILPFYIDASRFIEAENASPVFFVIVVLFDSPYSEVAIIDRQEIRETLPFRQSEYFFAIMQVVYLDEEINNAAARGTDHAEITVPVIIDVFDE